MTSIAKESANHVIDSFETFLSKENYCLDTSLVNSDSSIICSRDLLLNNNVSAWNFNTLLTLCKNSSSPDNRNTFVQVIIRIRTILDSIDTSKSLTRDFIELLEKCMSQCVQSRDSVLLKSLFKIYANIEKDKSKVENTIKFLTKHAIKCRSYYIVQVLFKIGVIHNRIVFNFQEDFDLAEDIFLCNFLLKRKIVDVTKQRGFTLNENSANCGFAISLYKYTDQPFLGIWLKSCFCEDIENLCPEGVTVLTALLSKNASHPFLLPAMGILLRLGADVKKANRSGESPIHKVVDELNFKAIHLLLQYGLNPSHLVDSHRVHLLKKSVDYRRYDIIKLLLLAGVKIPGDISIILQNPPLHWRGGYEGDRKWIENWLTKTRSLQFFCRKTTRENLGQNLGSFLRHTHFPPYLKDYLLLKHFE